MQLHIISNTLNMNINRIQLLVVFLHVALKTNKLRNKKFISAYLIFKHYQFEFPILNFPMARFFF